MLDQQLYVCGNSRLEVWQHVCFVWILSTTSAKEVASSLQVGKANNAGLCAASAYQARARQVHHSPTQVCVKQC